MVRAQLDPPIFRGKKCVRRECARYAWMRIGGLAQLGEHLLCKQGVVGSIPSSSTNKPAGKRKEKKKRKIKPTPKRL